MVSIPFHLVKNLFSHRKIRYLGLEKNTAQLLKLFDFAKLVQASKWLLAPDTNQS